MEYWVLKGWSEIKGANSRNEKVVMDGCPHKKRQDKKWLYTRKDWFSTNWEKDERKSIEVVWTRTNKATRDTNEKGIPHGF